MDQTRTDSPRASTRRLTIEARTIDYVPAGERRGRVWHQPPFWFLGNLQPLTLTIGFIGPAAGLSFGWSVVALLAGFGVGTLFMALHGSQGPVLGLPQMVQTRAQLGYAGVSLALVGVVFAFFGSAVVMAIITGLGMEAALGAPATILAVVAVLLSVALAVFGHDLLHRIFRLSLYVSLPVWLLITGRVIVGDLDVGSAAGGQGGFALAGFLIQFATAAAYNISYAPAVSDYTRYLPARTPSGAVIASVFGGAIASPLWLTFLGAWLAGKLGVSDPIVAVQTVGDQVADGLGGVFVVVTAAALISAMGLCFYSSALGLITAADAVRPVSKGPRARLVTLALLTVVAVLLVVLFTDSVIDSVTVLLQMAGYLLVPWSAINLLDFFVVRRGRYATTHLFRRDGCYGVWNKAGVPAYFVGLICLIPFVNISFFTGPAAAAMDGVDIALFVGLVAAGVAYLLLVGRLDKSAEDRAVAESDEVIAALDAESVAR